MDSIRNIFFIVTNIQTKSSIIYVGGVVIAPVKKENAIYIRSDEHRPTSDMLGNASIFVVVVSVLRVES